MTAEGSTGAPLRQQIAEAIHAHDCENSGADFCTGHLFAADAVVALLNLTEETATIPRWGDCYGCATPSDVCRPPGVLIWSRCCPSCQHVYFDPSSRYVTPWPPSTPPDTSSSETT